MLLPAIGLVLLLLASDGIAVPAGAGTKQVTSRGKGSRPDLLLLQVTVNGQRLNGVILAEHRPGLGLLLPHTAWKEARLAPLPKFHALADGTLAYLLDDVPDMDYRLNRQRLTLEMEAPPAAFIPTTLEGRTARAVPSPRPHSGATLNYDLALTYSGRGIPLASGAILEASAYGSAGNFVTSGLVRDEDGLRTAQRLDTFWRYDMPHRMETLVLGDTIGTGGGWSRPVRYGGLRWGRDFGMRPGFITQPQLDLAGEAALPSTVDIMVNSTHRQSQRVQPGPFELTDVPTVSGVNEVSLVMRDLLGRETVVRHSFYASPRLLAKGINDFSLEAGWLRTGYGQNSDYGPGFLASTLRRGLTPRVTGETRMEAQSRRRAGGIELAGLLGNLGTGWIALAVSETETPESAQHGGLFRIGVERSTPKGGGSVQYEQASMQFSPFGESVSEASRRVRERWLANMGGPLWGNMSGGASYVRQRLWNGNQMQAVYVSASLPLRQRASLSLSLQRQFGDKHSWHAGLIISVPLEPRIRSAMRISQGRGSEAVGTASLARSAPAGPGWGWRLETSTIRAQRARAAVQYNNSVSEWNWDGVSDADGELRAARVGAMGSVGLLAGMTFAARPLGSNSFAMVEVPGMPGVPIKYRHQQVARTDARGLAFIPGLLPWRPNRIEVDPANLPLDASVDNPVQEVTPYRGSGSVVRFRIRRTTHSLVVLHQADGRPVPLRAQVRLQAHGEEFIAGQRGEVWLTGVDAGRQRLQVGWNGGSCEAEITLPVKTDDRPEKIGPVICGEAVQ